MEKTIKIILKIFLILMYILILVGLIMCYKMYKEEKERKEAAKIGYTEYNLHTYFMIDLYGYLETNKRIVEINEEVALDMQDLIDVKTLEVQEYKKVLAVYQKVLSN